MSSPKDLIKEKLSINDVVSSYIKLEKAGINFKARCPFHNEKTPSFMVSPARGSFYCFGCGAKGDIFSFVEQIEGLDFVGALKVLAERAGVTLEPYRGTGTSADEKSRLLILLETATNFFVDNLRDMKDALKYLKDRGLEDKTIKEFRLGFAKDEWRNLHDFLLKKEWGVKDMERVGLVKRSEGKVYDHFRGRIMFPLSDSAGRIVGFSGRIFGKEAENVGKYVNSPETEFFNKSKILYGFDRAKLDIRRKDFAVLVEGQMDLLMSHQAGVTNSVALSGTALTRDHLEMLRRLSNRLIIALDADSAGFRASLRGALEALSLGMEVKIATIPPGMDPAELIKKDKKEWIEVLKDATHIVDFSLMRLTEKFKSGSALRREIEKEVLPIVARLGSKIEKAQFIGKIATLLRVPEIAVREELVKLEQSGEAAFIKNKEITPEKKGGEKLSPKEQILRKVLGVWLLQKEKKNKNSIAAFLKEREKSIEVFKESNLKKLADELSDGERQGLLFEAELLYKEDGVMEEDLRELSKNLEKILLKERFEEAMEALGDAERQKNMKRVEELLKECQMLSARIKEISPSIKKI